MILQASQFLATLSTTLFCGAAIYINVINVAEHPSRTDLDKSKRRSSMGGEL
jgi:hypothetical protein